MVPQNGIESIRAGLNPAPMLALNPDGTAKLASNECRCRLLDGSIHVYSFAVSQDFIDQHPTKPEGQYLGQGVIYAIGNDLQHGETILHFWA